MIEELKAQTAEFIKKTLNTDTVELETPKNLEHGHLAYPVFSFAKILKKAPPVIAQEISKKLSDAKPDFIEAVNPIGGFVNIVFKNQFLQGFLFQKISSDKDRLGYTARGKGRRVVIDYSSPNVAKPMSIGHLRATVIGQAIRNLAETQGFQVTGLNYLGDWGVQFGKLAWAFMKWGKEYPFEEKPFDSLYNLYVRFHDEAEKNEDLDKEGSLVFKRLENKDPEITKLWKMFLDISLKEYNRIYGLLNIKFDLIQGESFHNDDLEPTVELIRKKGILEESDGAQVVFLGENKPPCIIKKSDGASLYATRDIASAIYRKESLKADKLLYVVGVDQTLHFQQVFEVLGKLGYPWNKDCHHVAFGMYRFKDLGRMSTRKGNVVFMDDVLSKSMELARKIIEEKNPELKNKDEVARQVGVGAIVFHDLLGDRVKNVDFDWERVLDFEGDSGPYVQYTIVRCRSILRKTTTQPKFEKVLETKEERELVNQLLHYSEYLKNGFEHFKPNIVAQYLIDTCRAFNLYYAKHKILAGDESLIPSRLMLVKATETVLVSGLKVLGIEAPAEM